MCKGILPKRDNTQTQWAPLIIAKAYARARHISRCSSWHAVDEHGHRAPVPAHHQVMPLPRGNQIGRTTRRAPGTAERRIVIADKGDVLGVRFVAQTVYRGA